MTKAGKAAVTKREEMLLKKQTPLLLEIQRWYKNQCNVIKLNNKVDATDEGLEKLIAPFRDELNVWKDG